MAVRCLSMSASLRVWNLGWSLETTATYKMQVARNSKKNSRGQEITSISVGLKSADKMVDKQLIATWQIQSMKGRSNLT